MDNATDSKFKKQNTNPTIFFPDKIKACIPNSFNSTNVCHCSINNPIWDFYTTQSTKSTHKIRSNITSNGNAFVASRKSRTQTVIPPHSFIDPTHFTGSTSTSKRFFRNRVNVSIDTFIDAITCACGLKLLLHHCIPLYEEDDESFDSINYPDPRMHDMDENYSSDVLSSGYANSVSSPSSTSIISSEPPSPGITFHHKIKHKHRTKIDQHQQQSHRKTKNGGSHDHKNTLKRGLLTTCYCIVCPIVILYIPFHYASNLYKYIKKKAAIAKSSKAVVAQNSNKITQTHNTQHLFDRRGKICSICGLPILSDPNPNSHHVTLPKTQKTRNDDDTHQTHRNINKTKFKSQLLSSSNKYNEDFG